MDGQSLDTWLKTQCLRNRINQLVAPDSVITVASALELG
jgi:hypothetical protein